MEMCPHGRAHLHNMFTHVLYLVEFLVVFFYKLAFTRSPVQRYNSTPCNTTALLGDFGPDTYSMSLTNQMLSFFARTFGTR